MLKKRSRKPHHFLSISLKISIMLGIFLILSVPIVSDSICQAENLIFILDASGSMASEIKGKPKIEIMKNAFGELAKNFSPAYKVGLIAYGHRYKGDCNDAEELIPAAPFDRKNFTDKIQSIKAVGMSALSFSLQKAAESIRDKKEKNILILLADGQDACNIDACALLREMKAGGARFILHVIAFDVSGDAEKSLVCLAGAGGGTYFSAKNAGELQTVLKKAVELSGFKGDYRQAAPPVKPEETPPPPRSAEKKIINEISEIKFERSPEGQEKVIFIQSGAVQPKIFSLAEAIPKAVCDFSNTRISRSVSHNMKVGGKLIQRIRVGVHGEKEPKVRIVLDIAPNLKYEMKHFFSEQKNRYVVVLTEAQLSEP
ncbi:MAG: hypothetical protein BWK80_15855 [Desulfobacteraceae bacterium IS3]|nr:MAG: hypothetical protein BWK80_15855 [Desulfobacteraceae bacterium IS3]